VGHEAWMGEMKNAFNILENLKGRDHYKDLGVGRILEWILGK